MNEWQSRYQSGLYDILVWTLINSTRSLYRYLDLMEESLQNIKEINLKPLSDEEAKGISDYHRKIIDQYHSDNHSDMFQFSYQFYKSFVITIFSKIEKELLELCGEYHLDLKLLVSPDDREIIGTGIFRAYKFLAQGTSYSINSQLWSELQMVGKVRNRLVHNDWPYIAPVIKPRISPAVKIHFEAGDLVQDYYLQMDTEFYKYVSKHHIFEYGGGMVTSIPLENQYALFEIAPNYEYCQCLIDFRKRLFLQIFNDLLDISSQS